MIAETAAERGRPNIQKCRICFSNYAYFRNGGILRIAARKQARAIPHRCAFPSEEKGKSMKPYIEMTVEELNQELTTLKAEYRRKQALGMHLNMSRGVPC